MRHVAPIFFPLSSPDSSTAITSASDTPSAWAASPGLMSSGSAGLAVGVAVPPAKPSRIICCARPNPTASSAAVPAGPAPPLPASSPLPIWYFELIEIADCRHARSLVDRLFDLRWHRHVLDDEAGDLEAVLRLHRRVDEREERITQLRIARRHVEYRHLRRRQRVGEDADDARAHRVAELVQPEIVVGSGDLPKKDLRVHDFEIVGTEGAHADHTEVVVAEHHRIGRAPLVAGEETRDDEVDVGLEGRLEPVGPRFDPRQDGDVVGDQPVLPWSERVPELTEVHELHDLRFADDQLGAPLDGLVLVRETPGERVARVVSPLDDLEQLALDEIHQTHSALLTKCPPLRNVFRRTIPARHVFSHRAIAFKPAATRPERDAS